MREKELFAMMRGVEKVSKAIYNRHVTGLQRWKDTCWLTESVQNQCQPIGSSPPGGNSSTDSQYSSDQNTSKSYNNKSSDFESLRPDISQFEKKIKESQNLQSSTPITNQQRRSLTTQSASWAMYPLPVKTTHRSTSNESSVPSSRFGRLANYGQLAAGLALGSVGEMTSRILDSSKTEGSKNVVLSPDNVERIVATLCKIRGAALKLGQMLSLQDETLVPKDVQDIFERVRQSADFMPKWQMEKQINESLGNDWQDLLSQFNPIPFAAASIGQVHEARLKENGQKVAMKVQYPGVAESIDSDIDLLMAVLKYTNIIPKGLYLEQALDVAKKELAWECDYKREAAAMNKFRKALISNSDVYIPQIIPSLTSSRVLTTEFVNGLPVDQCVNLDQHSRNKVASVILQLCLTELFELRFMQTDPNFANFLYDDESGKINLIDFGASRAFDLEWVKNYIEVIKCAVDNDKDGIVHYSIQLGFLSGHETSVYNDAHCDAVLVLGEAFRTKGPFNFGSQATTKKIMNLVPTMVQHRLVPPPEETYSLHRKMSGAFLLCSKLSANIECSSMFDQLYSKYKGGLILVE